MRSTGACLPDIIARKYDNADEYNNAGPIAVRTITDSGCDRIFGGSYYAKLLSVTLEVSFERVAADTTVGLWWVVPGTSPGSAGPVHS